MSTRMSFMTVSPFPAEYEPSLVHIHLLTCSFHPHDLPKLSQHTFFCPLLALTSQRSIAEKAYISTRQKQIVKSLLSWRPACKTSSQIFVSRGVAGARSTRSSGAWQRPTSMSTPGETMAVVAMVTSGDRRIYALPGQLADVEKIFGGEYGSEEDEDGESSSCLTDVCDG